MILPFSQSRAWSFGLLLLLLIGVLPEHCPAQQPAPPPPDRSVPSSQSQPTTGPEGSSHQPRVLPFLILGTVFNEGGYAFPGVEVRIRRKGEKKFRYEVYTNSRGEFAVRVPVGIEYEVVVAQKKYKEQTVVVAAKLEDVQRRLSFKLEPVAPAKSGASR